MKDEAMSEIGEVKGASPARYNKLSSHFPYSPLRPTRVHATKQILSNLYSSILGPLNPHYPLPSAYHLGTLDDHDLGANNGDKSFELSGNGESNSAFSEFINKSNLQYYYANGSRWTPPEADVVAERSRRSEGVYGVKVFDFDEGGRVHHEEVRRRRHVEERAETSCTQCRSAASDVARRF